MFRSSAQAVRAARVPGTSAYMRAARMLTPAGTARADDVVRIEGDQLEAQDNTPGVACAH
jgi:hypothetical protein